MLPVLVMTGTKPLTWYVSARSNVHNTSSSRDGKDANKQRRIMVISLPLVASCCCGCGCLGERFVPKFVFQRPTNRPTEPFVRPPVHPYWKNNEKTCVAFLLSLPSFRSRSFVHTPSNQHAKPIRTPELRDGHQKTPSHITLHFSSTQARQQQTSAIDG